MNARDTQFVAYIFLLVGFILTMATFFTCNFMLVNENELLTTDMIPPYNKYNQIDRSDSDYFKFGLFRGTFYLEGSGSDGIPSSSVLYNTGECRTYRSMDGEFLDNTAKSYIYGENEDFKFQGTVQFAAMIFGLLAMVWSFALSLIFTGTVYVRGNALDARSLKMIIPVLFSAASLEIITLMLFGHGMCEEVHCKFGAGSILAIFASCLLAGSAILFVTLSRQSSLVAGNEDAEENEESNHIEERDTENQKDTPEEVERAQ